MRTEGERVQVLEGQGHIAVLAGEKKIGDMLVFLMYRKLKNTLGGRAGQITGVKRK
jgi:hypothetical protein